MICYVDLKHDNFNVLIKSKNIVLHNQSHPLGEQLLNFIYYDKDNFCRDIFNLVDLNEEETRKYTQDLDNRCIYLHGFMENCFNPILSGEISTLEGFKKFISAYPDESALVMKREQRFSNTTYKNVTGTFVILVIINHFIKIQNFISKQLEFCLNAGESKLLDRLTPNQRLYAYELTHNEKNKSGYFKMAPFYSRLIPIEPLNLKGNESENEIYTRIFDEQIQVEDLYLFDDTIELMRFEFFKLIALNIPIKKCKNCRRYFIPEKRIDTEYCNRPIDGQENKTCSSIGAMRTFQDKVKDSPILIEFDRAYQRRSARVRKKKMTSDEFTAWSKEARELRDKCLKGDLPFEDFKAWLNQDKINKDT